MAKRVLAIGVGGTGKAALTIFKERLEETYGEVPDNVVLLSFDTDELREGDRFAGAQLTKGFDARQRPPEFRVIDSPAGMRMDRVFADIRNGRTDAYMYWLEHEKLSRILSPAELDIRGGAQQRRPIGRTALFLRYNDPISSSIINAIQLMYGEPEDDAPLDAADVEKSKRQIFIVGSVAGGTGSGMFIDIANLVRHIVDQNPNWQSVSVSAIIVLPDAFAAYTRFMDDPTNLKPNSFAALRELDRFTRVHSTSLPYMIRYDNNLQSITWSLNQPMDHVYLVDTASRSASQDFDLSGDPMRGVFPAVADFLMAHTDASLGDALATLRSNAGQNYNKSIGRNYSGFNIITYIFPVDDVIESFTYRFLQEMLQYTFLPIQDETERSKWNQKARDRVKKEFTRTQVAGQPNPPLIQKSIAATRRVDPETPDISWPGLLSLISLSDEQFTEIYQFLQGSLDYLDDGMVLTKEGEYKKESFDEGATRLQAFYDQFLDDYLGQKVDPDDESSRIGGQWDSALKTLPIKMREQFEKTLDAALLSVLNERDQNRLLRPHRLDEARMIVDALKKHLEKFKRLLEATWDEMGIESMLVQTNEALRSARTWMEETRFARYMPMLFRTEPKDAQESFRSQALQFVNLILHQRVYQAVLETLDALGASERDAEGRLSVIRQAELELENWQETMKQVAEFTRDAAREHQANRREKRRIKVRKYLTDPEFEDELYRHPDHMPWVMRRVMAQVGSEKGLEWQRKEGNSPLNFKIVSTWSEEASGAEKIFSSWFVGAKGLFGKVRENVTVAERMVASFSSHADFINMARQVDEPFLRYNPSKNEAPPFQERYVSFNVNKAKEEPSRVFLGHVRDVLADQGFNVDVSAESVIACTVLEISRGVRLAAVDAFTQCEPEYRNKLYQGRESIHLFTEEQEATRWEQAIPTLGETDNRMRMLSPEVTIALGDPIKVRAFTLACAYELIYEDEYLDPATGGVSTELWMRRDDGPSLLLSQSAIVRALEHSFANLPAEGQIARLYLNALQNFALKITRPKGYNPQLVQRIKADLSQRGVSLQGIDNPFELSPLAVDQSINRFAEKLGANGDGASPSRSANARERVRILQTFLDTQVRSFKLSPDIRIKDMGTIMHLILREEINRLKQIVERG